MDIKCVLFLIASLICVQSQYIESSNQDEKECRYIYYCCEKIDISCVKYCGPFVECNSENGDVSSVTETPPEPSQINATEVQGIQGFQVIASICRAGFRRDSSGKCKRKMK